MNYNYTAYIQGGIGPDVWDREVQISAVDFMDAAKQAVGQAEDLGGQVVEVQQWCGTVPPVGSKPKPA